MRVEPHGQRVLASQPSAGAQERIGRFEVLRKIATGGMAELFLAKQVGMEGFEKVVAIKRILAHLAHDEEFINMFRDEARIVAKLSHPNIVQIYDLGKSDESYFIAMEYIPGRNLSSIAKKARAGGQATPPEYIARCMAQACEGLYYAHTRNDLDGRPLRIVHRDVSPQNIIVSFSGTVKLVDFGIAKAATKIAQTRAGVLKGKYAYMSPEQIRGEEIDARSDLFAAGIVLYELLAGKRPFEKDNSIQTLKSIVQEKHEDPRKLNPRIPDGLVRIVDRALKKSSKERYQDAQELQIALEDFVSSSDLRCNNITISKWVTDLFEDELSRDRGGTVVFQGVGEVILPDVVEKGEKREDGSGPQSDSARDPPGGMQQVRGGGSLDSIEGNDMSSSVSYPSISTGRRALIEEGVIERASAGEPPGFGDDATQHIGEAPPPLVHYSDARTHHAEGDRPLETRGREVEAHPLSGHLDPSEPTGLDLAAAPLEEDPAWDDATVAYGDGTPPPMDIASGEDAPKTAPEAIPLGSERGTIVPEDSGQWDVSGAFDADATMMSLEPARPAETDSSVRERTISPRAVGSGVMEIADQDIVDVGDGTEEDFLGDATIAAPAGAHPSAAEMTPMPEAAGSEGFEDATVHGGLPPAEPITSSASVPGRAPRPGKTARARESHSAIGAIRLERRPAAPPGGVVEAGFLEEATDEEMSPIERPMESRSASPPARPEPRPSESRSASPSARPEPRPATKRSSPTDSYLGGSPNVPPLGLSLPDMFQSSVPAPAAARPPPDSKLKIAGEATRAASIIGRQIREAVRVEPARAPSPAPRKETPASLVEAEAPLVRRKRTVFLVSAGMFALILVVVGVALLPILQPSGVQLIIRTDPAGAKVFIDGQPREDATPLQISGLEPGRTYSIRLDLAGYEGVEEAIRIPANKPYYVWQKPLKQKRN